LGVNTPGHDGTLGERSGIKIQCPFWAFFIASSCAGLALP
jgi:hypothetical protein